MKQEFIDLAKYRLEKARNTLSDAKKYINNGKYILTTNTNLSAEDGYRPKLCVKLLAIKLLGLILLNN